LPEDAEPIEIKSPTDLLALIEETINRLRAGPFSVRMANAIFRAVEVAARLIESAGAGDGPAITEEYAADALARCGPLDPAELLEHVKRLADWTPDQN